METLTKHDIELRAYYLMVQHRLIRDGWDIRWNRSNTQAALCKKDDQLIVLSEPILLINKWEVIRDAVLHEIAHALVPTYDHGEEWRRKFIEIGGSGCRLLHCVVPPGRYALRCDGCGSIRQWYRNKPPSRNPEGRSCRERLECRPCLFKRNETRRLRVIDNRTGLEVEM